jgi:hypothetical protein
MEEEIISILTIDSFSVIHNIIEGEAVVMNLDTGLYYSLNPAASIIWQKITEGQFSEDDIKEFAGQQNIHFIDFLIDQELVSPGRGPLSAEESEALLSPLSGTAEWNVFSDMKELLLLDPVHDIALSENGWSETRDTQKEL